MQSINLDTEYLEKIKNSFQKTFGSGHEFSQRLKKEDLNQWDSLHHVVFMISIEKEFGIKLDGSTVAELVSIEKILEKVKALKANGSNPG